MCKELVNLAFVTNGGAGTLFIQANFIYCVSQYLQGEPVRIEVFAHKSKDLNDSIFGGQDFIDAYYNSSERYRVLSDYDVSVNLNFYPEVLMKREEKIVHSPKLLHLLEGWQCFLSCDAGRQFYVNNFGLDINGQILAIIQGKNCLNILDVTDELKVNRDYTLRLIIHKSEKKTLKQWDLVPRGYITLQRGGYPALNVREVPKIWPVAHYEELVRLLKKCFPDKKIVQLGESKERCCTIQGIDVSLVGETDWEDLKVLLKNAWLHIDGECGMVHLRKILQGGPSVVLFGPTSVDFYGYDGNINVSSNACPHWCCKLTEDTNERCIYAGEEKNQCMVSIKAFQVLDRIVEWAYMMKICKDTNEMEYIPPNETEFFGTVFNPNFAKDFFTSRYVYYSETKCVSLSKLQVKFTVTKKNVAIIQAPAYQLLNGNDEGYKALLAYEENELRQDHDEQLFWKLYSSIEQGYDMRYKIVVSPEYRIYDGHHRASFLAHIKGVEHEIDVLVIYSIILFPFYKIPRNSRVVIYGLGEIGKIYVRQLKLSNYAIVECIIDRYADRMRDYEKEYGIRIELPDAFFDKHYLFDYVVLAMGRPKDIREASDYLMTKNVLPEQIVHNGLMYV